MGNFAKLMEWTGNALAGIFLVWLAAVFYAYVCIVLWQATIRLFI